MDRSSPDFTGHLLVLSACVSSPSEILNPEPSPEPCGFNLPSLSGFTNKGDPIEIVFYQYTKPPEEWLLVTDELPDAHIYILEEGGMSIELPGYSETELAENERVRLHMPGYRELAE